MSRLVSLDVFRGITIAGMVLVNNPGTWSSIYWPLEHAAWHGWTPTDLVFPFFLFIVGVSITLAFARRVEEGTVKRDLYLKVLKRSAIIFGLGLFLNGFPYFNLATIRIVPSGKYGNPLRKRPSPKMMALRLMTFRYRSRLTVPSSTRRANASVIETPTMNRKNGKTRSVGVQPCHSACSSGQ